MTKTFLLAAGAALLATVPAAAQPPRGGGGGFGRIEGDLTRAQAEQLVRDQIGRLDTNHDGIVTDKEIEGIIDRIATAGGPERMGEFLHRLVKEFGHDGRLVIDDLVKARMAQFDAADTNHDGKLSPDERQAAMAAARERMGGAPAQAPAPAQPAPKG
jgi:hypothetical protein